MGVFLRWGILGILSVAALMYAYNASKRLAESRARQPAPTAAEPEPAAGPEAEQAADPAASRGPSSEPVVVTPTSPAPPTPAALPPPAHCEQELLVAKRAIEMKKAGEPLDRLLRIQEIAWQEPAARRERLTRVATRWYGYEGDFQPDALRIAVISDCVQRAPAP